MASLLDFVPGLGAIKALVTGLAIAGMATVAGGLLYYQPKGERIGAARVQGAWDAAERRRQAQAIQALEAQRAEERRQADLQREILNEAERLATRARTAAARALDAGRVFVSTATAAAVAGSGLRAPSSAAAGSCEAATDAAILPAGVLGEIEQRLRDLAGYATEAHLAGLVCERSYDALTPRAELTVTSMPDDW